MRSAETVEIELDKAWSECTSGRARQALNRLDAVRGSLDSDPDNVQWWRCEWVSGWASFFVGQAESGLLHSKKANELSGRFSLDVRARSMALNARLLSCLGLSDLGLAEAEAALKLAEHCGDDWTLCLSCYVMADCTVSNGDLELALDYAKRGAQLARALGDGLLEAWVGVIHGYILGEMAERERNVNESVFVRRYEEAIAVCLATADIAAARSEAWSERLVLSNAVEYLAQLGRFDESHRLLERWNRVAGDEVGRRRIHHLFSKAGLLFREGRLEDALTYCQLASELTEAEGLPDKLHPIVKLMSDIQESLGDFQSALLLFKRYHGLIHKLEGEMARRRARVTEIHFELERLRGQAEDARIRAEQSEKDASTDPLTGLANRRWFDRRFEETCLEGRTDFAVLYLDLDHFKIINDHYSHAMGDDVLKAFARIVTGCCRQYDLVARFGGEEFVVLLRQVEARSASATGERILEATRRFDWSGLSPGLSVTASAGLALAHEGIGRDELLALADARLYEAKASGRDRLVARGNSIKPSQRFSNNVRS